MGTKKLDQINSNNQTVKNNEAIRSDEKIGGTITEDSDTISLRPTVKLNNDNYEILNQLGEAGGFGITYLAYDKGLKSKVAIKEYFPRIYAKRESNMTIVPTASKEQKDDFEWGYKAFKQEAQTIANLPKHPNVIDVKSLFEENGTVYFVMSYEEGMDLEQYLQENHPLTQSEIEGILYPLLDGIKHIHKSNILHRDIKLPNIIITKDKQPILIDFGTARNELNQRVKKMTAVYTEGYASLEQHTQSKEGAYTDIYAVGMLIYALVNGITDTKQLPSAIKRYEAMNNKEASLLTFPDDGRFTKQFITAVKNALEVEAPKRPQTIDEFLLLLKSKGGKPPLNWLKIFLIGVSITIGLLGGYYFLKDNQTIVTPQPIVENQKQGIIVNEQVQSVVPSKPQAVKQQDINYLQEANKAIQNNNIPLAIEHLKNEVEKNKSPKVALQIAELYEMLENEMRNAIKWYQTAEEMGNLKAKYPLAILYCKEGNYAKFQNEKSGILDFAKDSRKEFKYDVGLCFNELGNIKQAIEWFKLSSAMGYVPAKESLSILLKSEFGYSDTKIQNIIKNIGN